MRRIAGWLIVSGVLLAACTTTEQATPIPRGPVVPTRAIVSMTPPADIAEDADDSRLEFGESIGGRIRGSIIENRFQFEAESGDIVLIRMRADSGDLDSYLILEGPDGEEVARNDDEDSSQGYDAGLLNISLPVSGIYTIIATRFNPVVGTTEGDFTLTLERGEAIEVTPESTQNADDNSADLRPGSTVIGMIDDATSSVHYPVDAQAGHVMSLRVIAADDGLDPMLILRGPDGGELVRGESFSQDRLGARIANFPLLEDGVYTVVVTRFGGRIGRSAGEYTLFVDEGRSDGETVGIPTRALGYGARAVGNITDTDDRHLYRFEGSAGDVISLVSTANDPLTLDTFMILTDANGNEISRNDDNIFLLEGDDSLSAAIFFQPLPEDGFYTVSLGRFGRGTGQYTLELMLEERGDSKADRFYLGVIDPATSFGQLGTGARITLFAAGDWIAVDGDDDVRVSALITVHLPDLPDGETVRGALLDLSSCLIRGGDVFTALGDITAYQNAMFATIADIDTSLDEAAPVFATLGDCEIVDVTGVIRDAYAADMRLVQFRLATNVDTLVVNGVTDAVIFPYPRLEITTG